MSKVDKQNKKKKKKEKIIYVDDGRQIADMSAFGSRPRGDLGPRGGCREQWQTYIRSVRSMLLPMLVVMGAICIIFGILYIIFSFSA